MKLLDALSLGKYGIYVWSCYGITAVALVWLIATLRAQLRRELGSVQRRIGAVSNGHDVNAREQSPALERSGNDP